MSHQNESINGDVRIADVQVVEIRGVRFGEGLVAPWSRQVHTTRDYIAVKITTDTGLWAVTMDGDYSLPVSTQVVRDIGTALVGRRVADMHQHTRLLSDHPTSRRLHFIEIALWDLLGQAAGLPLFRLWGGVRDRVPAYASTVHFGKSPAERAEDCLKYLERGYRAVKLRASHDTLAEDVALVAAVREAVDDRMTILVDANQAGNKPGDPRTWDYRRALDTARELERLQVGWLEEPLSYRLQEQGIRLAREVDIPIAGGEGKRGLAAFWELVHHEVYDVVQPDPVVSGTPFTLHKIGALCEAAARPVVFHHGKSGVGMMMALHLSAASADSPWLEYMDDPGFWEPTGFQVGFEAPLPLDADGCVRCPDAPGLGIPWDHDWLRHHGI